MEAKRFTVKSIEALKKQSDRYEVREKGSRGLAIRVSPSGRKTWVSIYRIGGKLRRYTHGDFPEMGIEEAHKAHAEIREALKQNRDPGEEKRLKKRTALLAPTVKGLAAAFLDKKKDGLKEKTLDEYERILAKDVIPVWGNLKAQAITRQHVKSLVDEVAERGGIQGNRTLATVRSMFSWAVDEFILPANPALGMTAPAKEKERQRVLNQSEVANLWRALDSADGMSEDLRVALKLILVTGQRPGEVARLHCNEIDGDWLVIPPERSKNKKAHRVFLSPLAKQLIGEPSGGFRFSKLRDGRPFAVSALSKAVHRHREHFQEAGVAHFTPHDLRRTAGTMITAQGASRELLKAILNHVDKSVTAIYDRHSYDTEKKRALLKHSRGLEKLISGDGKTADVVKIHGA